MDVPCALCGGHWLIMLAVQQQCEAPHPVGLVKWWERVCLPCHLERERQAAHDAERAAVRVAEATAPGHAKQPKTRAGAHG